MYNVSEEKGYNNASVMFKSEITPKFKRNNDINDE